jgi:hypothetical protein
MIKEIDINSNFQLAADYINTTNEHIYLTGKAGTGKTTFLKYIKENCHKKLAVAAPTGVAAINAGGVTLHSLFQLPLGGFLPEPSPVVNEYSDFFDKQSLLKHLRINKSKRQLLQELELLIIDEVSMLRADLLDAIDTILKSVRRRNHLAFGGVQILFIGDLFQLPPVIKNHEWQSLSKFYQSPSFFNALALQNSPPVYLELKNIYRQSDENFIRILNNIRNNQADTNDLELLNQYYKPEFKPKKEGEFITLTTHNQKADSINSQHLSQLSGKVFEYPALISGDFNENTVTAETTLRLKEGAQVMFVRNDKEEKPRYYNGKIGVIKSIHKNDIKVQFPDSGLELIVARETWENKKYKLNKETQELEEDVKGTFTQYPIRLAWAITIHKSQGLTFDKAIIDAGESFAPGQVYVALSRLTSLEGLVLYSKISNNNISSDKSAIAFSTSEKEEDTLKTELQEAQVTFVQSIILKAFEWQKLKWACTNFLQEMDGKHLPEKDEAISLVRKVDEAIKNQQATSSKFTPQLESLLDGSTDDHYEKVNIRIQAAVKYFKDTLTQGVIDLLQSHHDTMKKKSGVKKYLKELNELIAHARINYYQLNEIALLTNGLADKKILSDVFSELTEGRKARNKRMEKEFHKEKRVIGESQRLSLELFKEGKSIDDIAQERSLSPSTIEGHLIGFIGTELYLHQIVDLEKSEQITKVIESLKEPNLGAVKAKLGDEFSYSDIRAVMNDRKAKETNS